MGLFDKMKQAASAAGGVVVSAVSADGVCVVADSDAQGVQGLSAGKLFSGGEEGDTAFPGNGGADPGRDFGDGAESAEREFLFFGLFRNFSSFADRVAAVCGDAVYFCAEGGCPFEVRTAAVGDDLRVVSGAGDCIGVADCGAAVFQFSDGVFCCVFHLPDAGVRRGSAFFESAPAEK